jgi:hypothetical protein
MLHMISSLGAVLLLPLGRSRIVLRAGSVPLVAALLATICCTPSGAIPGDGKAPDLEEPSPDAGRTSTPPVSDGSVRDSAPPDMGGQDVREPSPAPDAAGETGPEVAGADAARDDAALPGADAAALPAGSLVTAAPYRCTCDGAKDDSACLQGALADWANWRNRTLEWPAGATCRVLGLGWRAPEGSAGSRYFLKGNGATLKAPDGAPVAAGRWLLRIQGGRWLVVDRLNFHGNRATRMPREVPAHNLLVSASQDVELRSIVSQDAVADNLYILGRTPVETDPSFFARRITVRDPVMRRAFRNNISIINCDGCRVIGDGRGANSSCQLTDARGTRPQQGIDFEPNPGTAVPGIVNSGIEGCYIARNEGACIGLARWTEAIVVRNNLLEDCRKVQPTCGAAFGVSTKALLVEKNTIRNFKLLPGCRALIDFGAVGADSPAHGAVVRDNIIEGIEGVPDNGHILYIHPVNPGGQTFERNTMRKIGVQAGGDWCTAGNTAMPNVIRGNTVDGQVQQPDPGCP